MVQFNFATANYYINDEGVEGLDVAISPNDVRNAIKANQNGWRDKQDIERAFDVAAKLNFTKGFALQTLAETRKGIDTITATGVVAREIERLLKNDATNKVRYAVEMAYHNKAKLDHMFEEELYL